EKRFDFLFMAPSSQSLEPPQKPGRFTLQKFEAEAFPQEIKHSRGGKVEWCDSRRAAYTAPKCQFK
uniref:hypothetical protein n=1 Tax=Orrella sp. TaxID=1921583 RepID=UPI0040479A34